MATPQTATGIISFGNNYSGLGIKDANGNYALAHTPFYQNASGILIPAPVDANGNPQNALANAPLSATVTMQNAATAIGIGTSLSTNGQSVAVIEVTGTFVGTVEFDVQGPGGGWYARNAKQIGTGAWSTTTTAPGLFVIDVRGCQAVRANITAYTSGSITAKGNTQTGSAPDDFMSLSGRNATQIATLYNALAITDTTSHNTAEIDVSGYKELIIFIRTTLNQPCNINLSGAVPDLNTGEWTDSSSGSAYQVTVSATNVTYVVDGSNWTPLDRAIPKMALTCGCTTAPTSGTLTVVLYGAPR